MAGLPRDDEELVSLITQLVMASEREPAEPGAMELNFMLLELQRIEHQISSARKAGDYEAVSRLSREGAELTTRIAQGESLDR